MLRIKKTNIYKSKSKKISSNQLIFILIFNQKKYGKYHLKLLRTCQILYI
jgi:hypothetical protein